MGTACPQLAPVVLVLLAGTWTRAKPQHAATATAIIVAFVFALCAANLRWFGISLGAQALLQGLNARGCTPPTPCFSSDSKDSSGCCSHRAEGCLSLAPWSCSALQECVDHWRQDGGHRCHGASWRSSHSTRCKAATPSGGVGTRLDHGTCSTYCRWQSRWRRQRWNDRQLGVGQRPS